MMTIESMDPQRDLDAVLAIEQATFSQPATREAMLWELAHSDVSACYVLRIPEEPVAAYCAIWLVLDELHINSLAVRPEWRRRGLATALLGHVLSEASRQGATRATLEMRVSNLAAQRLYAGYHFVETGRRRDYYAAPREDALILSRALQPGVRDGRATPPG